MRYFATVFVMMCCMATVYAQLGLELVMSRSIYLAHEPIFAKVKIRNYSGQPLVFGEDSRLRGEVLFEFVGPDQRVIAPLSDHFSMVGTILMPGESKELIIPVSRYYNFRKAGVYRGHAYVKHQLLKDMFKSNDCRIEVSNGVPVWKRSVGVPEVIRTNGLVNEKIKSRNYVLKTMVEGATKHYYLSIEDEKNIYAVLHVGREVGVERFKAEIDMLSRLHLIVPISPRIFHYNIINLNGQVELDQYLKTTRTVPSLVREPQSGAVHAVGGDQALPGVDYEVKGGIGGSHARSSSMDTGRVQSVPQR